jgi:hypothetical protein
MCALKETVAAGRSIGMIENAHGHHARQARSRTQRH